MRAITLLICVLAILNVACQRSEKLQKIDLSGTWQFALDPSDKGISEGWFNKILTDTLTLPGSLTSNGKGDDI
ncbi:MAG TPA: hypothetical protein VGK38_08005, partial [Prolixibacteraceae bacterium]